MNHKIPTLVKKLNPHNPTDSGVRVKILIATGIYPPDIGGPATYSVLLNEEFKKVGYKTKIITYSDFVSSKDGVIRINRKQNIFFRYIKYFLTVFKLAKGFDIVYVLDLMSAGLPAMLAARVRGKKVVFRTGGDFLWEKAFATNWTNKSLEQYYEDKKNIKEKFLIWFCRWILKKIDFVIFSTELQKKIYVKHYFLELKKTFIITNAVPDNSNYKISNISNKIIFAGRLIKLKNLDRLINVFKEIKDSYALEIYGEGPQKREIANNISKNRLNNKIFLRGYVEHSELLDKISRCRFVILPSITEISPNLALECLSMGKPIIVTKNTGFEPEILKEVIMINPFSTEDTKNKISFLLDNNSLLEYEKKLNLHKVKPRSWQIVAKEHLEIFKRL